jgi:hypothetical protein
MNSQHSIHNGKDSKENNLNKEAHPPLNFERNLENIQGRAPLTVVESNTFVRPGLFRRASSKFKVSRFACVSSRSCLSLCASSLCGPEPNNTPRPTPKLNRRDSKEGRSESKTKQVTNVSKAITLPAETQTNRALQRICDSHD